MSRSLSYYLSNPLTRNIPIRGIRINSVSILFSSQQFFFSTSFLLKINHPIINHFSIVSILPQRSAQALLRYSFPFNSFIGKRNHPFERDYRTSTTNDAKIERARSKQAITRDPRFSWRCRNTLRRERYKSPPSPLVSPFLNDSMIKCHEFPEPRYIIHRERGRRFDSARRPLTVPRCAATLTVNW